MDNFIIQLIEILIISSYVLLIVGPLLICVAFLTYLERKVIAAVQYRKGPNVVGMFGLLQPFADGVKLFSKETIIPASANKVIFILAPMVSFALSLKLQKREKMGEFSKKFVSKNYSHDKMCNLTLSLYKQTIAEYKRNG